MPSTATAETFAGDDVAVDFTALVNRCWRDLSKLVYRLCGYCHTADRLVRETLTSVWALVDMLQNARAMTGRLYRIVRRGIAWRFVRYQPLGSYSRPEDTGSAGKTYDTSAEAVVLRCRTHELPAEHRKPLLFQVIQGYSQRKIAEGLGLISGARYRLFCARQTPLAAPGEPR